MAVASPGSPGELHVLLVHPAPGIEVEAGLQLGGAVEDGRSLSGCLRGTR